MANQYFRYFDLRIAEGVTLTGQAVIQFAERIINEKLNAFLGTKDKDRVIAIDTDSVAGSTSLLVNGQETTIAEFYESVDEDHYIRKDDFNRDYVKSTSHLDCTTLSVSSTAKLEERRINYVMKHSVKKRMFRIKTPRGSVDVTEDHSCIVRDRTSKKVFSIKPKDLNTKKHQIINIVHA